MEEKSLIGKYRKEANDLMREMHPELDWHAHCVHHIDRNPFNNDISNFRIVNKQEHWKFHTKDIEPSKTTESKYPCGCKVIYEWEGKDLKFLYWEKGFSCNLPHKTPKDHGSLRNGMKAKAD